MKTELADNLFLVAGVLSPSECAALIERGEALGFQQATVRTRTGRQMRTDIRNNDRAELCDPALAAELWPRVLPFLPQSLEDGEPVGLDDNFRFYRYDTGQRFNRHRDGVVEQSPTVRSRLSCLLYLNDGFTGGETVFYAPGVVAGAPTEVARVSPVAGTGLFFLHSWWHEGRLLEAGRKYVLRSDVFYQFPAD
jgi:predicted 2-oxoglutarate/Fe(II)-dependent dioxygenase YbiX